MTSSSGSRKPQVFINFRGKTQRENLVSSLKSKLEKISDINVFIDECEIRGTPITTLFERIRESSIALVIFSNKYPESCWCLDELVEIKKQMDIGSLVPFPVFYKVKPECVKTQNGYFLNTLLKTEDYVRKKVDWNSRKSILETEARIWGWRQALSSVCERMGTPHQHKNDESFINEIVGEVKKMLEKIPSPRNDLSIIERPQMHFQEEVTSLLQALKLKKSDLEDLIPKPSIHINGVVSLRSNHLVFLDLISLKNPILAQRLVEPVQAGKILLVLLGSVEYFNKGFAFKPLLLPKKTQYLADSTDVVANSYYQTGESNDNLRNREDNNSSAALTCFSFLCNILKRSVTIIRPPSRRVFISFGEKHLGKNLVSSLKRELESNEILVDVEDETKSRIKDSGVAIIVFSAKYPKSDKCLDELVEIKKLMDAGEIVPFPVFYNLKAESVKEVNGWFYNRLLKIENQVREKVKSRDDKSILDTEDKICGWRQALSIASRPGLSYEHSTDDVFVSDIVTKVKELFAFRERPMNPVSNITTNLVVEKPLMYRQETEPATAANKPLDDDLLYSLTSFLQVLNLKITDVEGFIEISNDLVSLSLKRHTNLVFLKLSSHENLAKFQRSDSFKVLTEGFALNPSGVSRFEEPSLALALESN
ncbi:Protein PHLOEM PROTEIN 2-LIKE A5 [Cardamine amara subsp. amara]|uniref:Protein PHLOEM PROTEIN 2-LIKE A5 n=1 Tax=Cardamine amara subsp. amara TaxID=228776 RepID=A0ABD1BZI9_CARAN